MLPVHHNNKQSRVIELVALASVTSAESRESEATLWCTEE